VVSSTSVHMEMPASFRRDKFRAPKDNKQIIDARYFSFDEQHVMEKKDGNLTTNYVIKGQ